MMSPKLKAMLKQPERKVKIHPGARHLLSDLREEELDSLEVEALTAQRTGELLQSARKSRKMTQKQLAEKLGRAQSRVAALENPGGEVALSSVVRVAHALGFRVTVKLESKDGEVLEAKW